MNNLGPRIERGLRSALDTIARRGELLSAEQLQEGYTAFPNRFAPDTLSSLDGEALLQASTRTVTRKALLLVGVQERCGVSKAWVR